MAKIQDYDDDARIAVRYHDDTVLAPNGWPDEEVLLSPDEDMKTGLRKRGYVEGRIPDFRLMSGKELGELKRKLLASHEEIESLIATELAHSARLEELDAETVMTMERQGFEWRGKRFSLSQKAQSNMLRAAQSGELPRTFSTVDHERVVVSTREEFRQIFLAFDRAIESHLDAGRRKKQLEVEAHKKQMARFQSKEALRVLKKRSNG